MRNFAFDLVMGGKPPQLYFEDNDIEGIIKKLESGKYVVSYVTELTELEGGQKLVRFYDPSGNLIEVRTPVNYS